MAGINRKGVFVVARKDGQAYTKDRFEVLWRREIAETGLRRGTFYGHRTTQLVSLRTQGTKTAKSWRSLATESRTWSANTLAKSAWRRAPSSG